MWQYIKSQIRHVFLRNRVKLTRTDRRIAWRAFRHHVQWPPKPFLNDQRTTVGKTRQYFNLLNFELYRSRDLGVTDSCVPSCSRIVIHISITPLCFYLPCYTKHVWVCNIRLICAGGWHYTRTVINKILF